jgi:HlyD family secretion protein
MIIPDIISSIILTQRPLAQRAACCVIPFILSYALVACAPAAPTYQGWVDADMLFIGADEVGRIKTLSVTEGQIVHAGDALFSLDQTTQSADVEASLAALKEAQSQLARVESAQQRPEEIAVLEANVKQAQAALDYSTADLERAKNLVERGFAPQSRLDQAKSVFDHDKAALETINRQITVGRLSGRAEDLNLALAAVEQAKAQSKSALARMMRLNVVSSVDGRVQEIYYRAGEIVPQGRPVVAVLPPDLMKIIFFVPQAIVPSLKVGDDVAITCDGCRDQINATISFISAQVEFTPPQIYSLQERQKLVFRIEARPQNPALLRVGQPVSVSLNAKVNP